MADQKQVLVTGAGGFVGGRVARALVDAGYAVRVLVRRAWQPSCPQHHKVEVARCDLRDFEAVRAACEGCHTLYHVAADYRFGVRDAHNIWANNVAGTEHLLRAAVVVRAAKVVHTSTVGTIGIASGGGLGNEQTPLRADQGHSHYKRSKLAAGRLALQAAAEGVPVVVVNPSTPIGPGDDKPTPTGQMLLDYLAGRMPAVVDTGLNFVHVDDVAIAHLLAAERGQVGQRYILGHQNLTMWAFLRLVGQVAGHKAPRWRMPWAAAYAAALACEAWGKVRQKPPAVAIEAVRMARHKMWFDGSRAVAQLGMPQTPIAHAVWDALSWFATRHRHLQLDKLMPRQRLMALDEAVTVKGAA